MMSGFGEYLKDYLDYHKISQTDFAKKLGISFKHMNEIIRGTTRISEELMLAISLITDIDVNFIFFIENKKRMYDYLYGKYKSDDNIKKFLNSYYLKEIDKRKWITLKDRESLIQCSLDLLEYLQIPNFENVDLYLKKKILYKKKDDADLKKVYLWIRRCDKLLLEQHVEEYHSDCLELLLNDLKKERIREFNVENIIHIFNRYGIYLVVEDALKGTKIRGCMMVRDNHPVIYMTKYLKEKASFYFALYHELGHVKSDYNKSKNKVITYEDDNINREDKADKFALEQMIPSDIYHTIISHFKDRDSICIENDIPLCFLYSRLAYEKVISYHSKEYLSHREVIE